MKSTCTAPYEIIAFVKDPCAAESIGTAWTLREAEAIAGRTVGCYALIRDLETGLYLNECGNMARDGAMTTPKTLTQVLEDAMIARGWSDNERGGWQAGGCYETLEIKPRYGVCRDDKRRKGLTFRLSAVVLAEVAR